MTLREKIYKFLRWSERYTKTDMVYLTRGGFWLTLGQIIYSLSIFFLAIAFANLVPKEIYGTYQYILSVFAILGVFSLTGMNSAVIRAVSKGFEGTLNKSFWVQIKWGLITFFACLAIAVYYFAQGNQVLAISFLIVGSFSPLLNSANTFNAFLNGKKDFKKIAQYNALSTVFSSLIILLTLLMTKNVILLILAYFFSNTLANVFFYVKTLRIFKPNENQDQETISYGKHLSLMNVISIIAYYLDGPLIFHFGGAAALAVYSMAVAPPEQIKVILKNISGLALPKFSEKSGEEIKKTIVPKVMMLGAVIALIVIFYIIIAPLAYKLFFPKYLESVFYSQIYAISLIAAILLVPYAALQGQMAKKELYTYNIASSLVQIVLFLIFIYLWGILGAVLSRVISRFFNLGLSLWLIKKSDAS